MRTRELRPIARPMAAFDRIQAILIKAVKDAVYRPLYQAMRAPVPTTVKNAADDDAKVLADALTSGRVRYEKGRFTGKFSAAVSRALRASGGVWDAKIKGYRLAEASLTPAIRRAVRAGDRAFDAAYERLEKQITQILPENIAQQIKIAGTLDNVLQKTDKDIASTLKGITVAPTLSPAERRRVADEWQNNVRLEIKNFVESEVQALRKTIRANVAAGQRYEGVIDAIQDSFGVSYRKAKFLARQETNLLVNKFKEVRYQSAGVDEYRWRCVVGSVNHPVRPAHKALENGVYRFSDPPVTTAANEPTRRNNPGEDFNCRCVAIPLARF